MVIEERGEDSEDYTFRLQSADEKEIYRKSGEAKKIQSKLYNKWKKAVYIDPKRKVNIAHFITREVC
ncbi:hypothetical protein KIN20_019028 [Parelaphostrongylus tenuis]|uniref:Uncharacterized protein n=1 Tax=Parelaphostrongylus tenuis TaxID=148309 RepID=A0AAD5N1R6_PARTN|nr:hypothetical protein KIN20_019028 [Parelaphostrongylus tenuis]